MFDEPMMIVPQTPCQMATQTSEINENCHQCYTDKISICEKLNERLINVGPSLAS